MSVPIRDFGSQADHTVSEHGAFSLALASQPQISFTFSFSGTAGVEFSGRNQ